MNYDEYLQIGFCGTYSCTTKTEYRNTLSPAENYATKEANVFCKAQPALLNGREAQFSRVSMGWTRPRNLLQCFSTKSKLTFVAAPISLHGPAESPHNTYLLPAAVGFQVKQIDVIRFPVCYDLETLIHESDGTTNLGPVEA